MEFIRSREYISSLKSAAIIVVSLLGISALATHVRGAVNDSIVSDPQSSTTDRPYSAIWLRNVFDLKPVPPPVVEAAKPNEPPPNVHLTGITTILGSKKALFMVQKKPVPGKPPTADESYILKEGQREGPLEVLEIDTKASTVKIRLEDIVSTITFETNKMNGGPGNMGGGNMGGPGQRFPHPGITPGYGGNAYPNRSAYPNPASYSPAPQTSIPMTYGGGYAGYAQPATGATANASTPNSSTAATPPTPTPPLQTTVNPPNVSDQERALIAAAESAIRSGNTTLSTGGSGNPYANSSVPNVSGISSITIPPVPTTPPPPLPSR